MVICQAGIERSDKHLSLYPGTKPNPKKRLPQKP